MGSGVSVHKHPESVLKFRFSTSSKDKKILAPMPTKENGLNGEDPTITQFGFKSQASVTTPLTSFRISGSKEETFFDSQAWLESDCEDDFLSVNGDFTPSRGSTSNFQSSYKGNPQLDKSEFLDRAPDLNAETSPTDKKMKLSELLRESLGGDETYEDQNTTNGDQLKTKPANLVHPSKSTNGISNLFPNLSKSFSSRSNDKTPNRYSGSEKEKPTKASHCCLPSLVNSLSFSERKKKMIPDHSGG
ncbi:hypothetical protein FRX31_028907 [Thalictrum thalictroides]|uniref:Uncharacterized protein n=1 Tax=Thalictrum thalictroides TaxID=46969 RepID=A0A7J6V8X4_THATH|nr:hypothetical protein FRX31_028907 [Thalictrum thalictroides]